ERSGEVAALLTSSVTSIRTALEVVGAVGSTGADSQRAFAASAKPLMTGNARSVMIVRGDGSRVVVGDSVGDGPAVGTALSGEREALARRALTAPDVVTTMSGTGSGARR